MLSKEKQLPAPSTSSVHLSLEADPKKHSSYAWFNVQMEHDLRAAIEDRDIPTMRRLALKLKDAAAYEHLVTSLIYEYATARDAVRSAEILKHIAPHASPMLSFWTAMSFHDTAMLQWIGQYDDLARYIFLPMPCPNNEWCTMHDVDRKNPGSSFRQWWGQYRQSLRQGVEDHLRVEWQRRFTSQPKLYYLLAKPSIEQAIFVATRPEPIWDIPVLVEHYPDIQSVFDVTHALYSGVAARQQMVRYFGKGHAQCDTYHLPF